MSKINWKKEVARDFLALGSLPFYAIVTARAVIGIHAVFVYQVVFGLIIFHLLDWGLRKSRGFNSDQHVGRAFLLTFFSSLYYDRLFFAIFAFLLFEGIIISSHYLKTEKQRKTILWGLLFSGLAALTAYLVAQIMPGQFF